MVLVERIMAIVPAYITLVQSNDANAPVVNIYSEVNKLYDLVAVLKHSSLIKARILVDIVVIDNPHRIKRFEIVVLLLSLEYDWRCVVKCCIQELGVVESFQDMFANAAWLEREVWDMFGIMFVKGLDLRRILTDYGFEGFPLRKDFPLVGYWEWRYDDEQQSLVREPVELSQDYRVFMCNSPWEEIVDSGY